ncbi:MAG TPA: VOC family protein [Actinomycetota bacterium]|nr:VOC family protein [Actinomycetota bacterium]
MTAVSPPLDHVYYWTSDMDRGVRFYQDVLGLPLVRRDGAEWALFDTGAVRFALHGATQGRPVERGGATAVFRVDDLDAARTALEARGAAFDEHVGEVQGFARFASFRDPDGNVVQLIEYSGDRERA